MSESPYIPIHTPADADNRISLPKEVSDRISWMADTEELNAWLLMLAPGRYRILSDLQVESDPLLEPIRLLILEGKAVIAAGPCYGEDLPSDSIVAQLVPIRIDRYKHGT